MSQFAPSSLNAPSGAAAAAFETAQRAGRPDVQPSSADVVRGEDQVELSAAARIAGSQNQPADIREDLVARIRSEIAAGTYETSDKLDATVSRLSRDLG